MDQGNVSIIVKVGKKSTSRFRNAKVYRAITILELDSLVSKFNPDILVIENIRVKEYDEAKTSISSFVQNGRHRAFILAIDNDEVTLNFANELGLEVFTDIKNLYYSIKSNFGVDTNISITPSEGIIVEDENQQFDDSYDSLIELTSNITEDIGLVETDTIKNKADANLQIVSYSELGIRPDAISLSKPTKVNRVEKYKQKVDELEDELKRLRELEQEKDEERSREREQEKTKEKLREKEREQEVKREQERALEREQERAREASHVEREKELVKKISEITASVEANKAPEVVEVEVVKTVEVVPQETIDRIRDLESQVSGLESQVDDLTTDLSQTQSKLSSTNESLSSTTKLYKASQDTIETLEDQVNDLKSQVATLTENLSSTQSQLSTTTTNLTKTSELYKTSQSRIAELNKVISSVKSERDLFKSEFEKFETSDIIEDPDTLADLTRLKDEINQLKQEASNRANISSDEVAKLQSDKSDLLSKIALLESKNSELDDRVNDLEMTKLELENNLRIAQDNTAKDDEIAELKSEISALISTKDTNTAEIQRLTDMVLAKDTEIGKYNTIINNNKNYENHLRELLSTAVYKVGTVSSLQSQIDSLVEQNTQLENSLNEVNAQLQDSRSQLDRVSTDTEKRITLARTFAQQDLDNTKQENVSLRAKLELVSNQLTIKETQYNQLVASVGMDESGASSVIETNKMLESMNATLRSQLAELKTDYTNLEREKLEKDKSIRGLQDNNQRLTSQIKAMSSNFTGGVGSSIIPPINYYAKGQILVFIGSGSYGVTTTAYSSAINLSSYGRVIYVDFDMVSAKADSWFKANPIVKGVVGVEPGSSRSSGLGIAIDKGVPFLMSNFNQIVISPIRTKSGCVDYLSGLYAKPDVVKLVSCDFSNLINSLGNMYDYIVIDFGRIGTSDINDQIIKLFSDISRSTVIVSTNDKFDVRNTRMNLQRLNINLIKAAWLINLADSTRLDESTKKRISPAEIGIMPFMDGFYGNHMDFTMERLPRDKFRQFLEKAVLRR